MTSFRFGSRSLATAVTTAVLVAALSALWPAIAGAVPFTASTSRFEADGNGYGPAGGPLDLVDEFDDGVLAPNWALLLGTAIESGGLLTVRDPGVTVPFLGLPQEISTVEGETELVKDGGDFTVTTYWTSLPAGLNQQYFFQLYGISPAIEASGMTVNYLDAAIAAGSGAPEGYSVGRQRVFPLGNQAPPVIDYVAIDAADVTGSIVLRLSYDDSTDLLTASFSLDGGTTFQSPFTPLQAFLISPDAELLIGAAAYPSSSPTTTTTTPTQPTTTTTMPQPPTCTELNHVQGKFQRLAEPLGEQRVRFTGLLPMLPGPLATLDPISQGARFSLTDGAGHLEVATVPPGPVGAGCAPQDGWKLSGRTYRYVNRSGLLPPTCTYPAGGLKKVTLKRDRGWVKFSLQVDDVDLTGPASGTPFGSVEVGQVDGGGNWASCGNHVLVCEQRGRTIRCE